jgi:hypothetical protein
VSRAVDAARGHLAGQTATVLGLDAVALDAALPPGWTSLPVSELADFSQSSREFLSFLERWPRQTVWNGKTFDELFRRRGGYSVWWTGPARGRHPLRGAFPVLNALWICDRAIRRVAAGTVLIHTGDRELADLLASRCRHRVHFEFLPGSAVPRNNPWSGRVRWFATAVARLPLLPVAHLIRALSVRLVTARAAPAPVTESGPAVVMACEWGRDVRSEGDRISPWFWEEFRDALARRHPGLVSRYRLVYRKGPLFFHPAWRALEKLRGALPADERNPAIDSWWRALPSQFASLILYFRLEGSATFRQSFCFAGADLASLYVPDLRRSVARSVDWAQAVAAAVQSLRAAGRVAAMMVVKEMYPSEMVTIAAARELGIPTIGVQHGTISPAHLMYTIPPGYVEGAPVPDFFAVYGDFARETVSVHGAYPADRVWVTGGARFDPLVRNLEDRATARQRLGLPRDTRVVLVTTQSSPWFPDVVRTVLGEARARPDWIVCIKTHPLRRAHVDLYAGVARECYSGNVRLYTDRFYDLLAACDVLISGSSTTVLEAILAGRRTICVNFSGEPDPYPYAADGGSLPARSPAELRMALDTVFAAESRARLEQDRQGFLKRHAGPGRDGRAAETLADRIVRLATAHPGEHG